MPPTSIDGTDITGATIDGTDVTEITVDGQTVFTPGPPPSLVSRWTYDNADTTGSTAEDIISGNDGNINGATIGVTGANDTYTTNEAYSFDGANDFVNAGDLGDPTDTFSVALWIEPANISSSNQYPLEYAESLGSFPTFVFRLEQNSGISGGNIQAGLLSGSGFDEITGTIVQNVWNHLVLVRDGLSFKFYVDGTNQGTASVGSGNNYTSGFNFLTGRRGNGEFWEGDIDDVRFYSKALTPSEVSSLYNTGQI